MSSFDDRRPGDFFLVAESVEDRQARLERIKEGISGGSYEVAAKDVADSLVAFFRRDFLSSERGNPDSGANTC